MEGKLKRAKQDRDGRDQVSWEKNENEHADRRGGRERPGQEQRRR